MPPSSLHQQFRNPTSALALNACTGGATSCAGQPDVQTGKSAALHHDLLSCPLKLMTIPLLSHGSSFLELDSRTSGATRLFTLDAGARRGQGGRSDGPYTLSNSAAERVRRFTFRSDRAGRQSPALTRDRASQGGRHRQDNALPAAHQSPVPPFRPRAEPVKPEPFFAPHGSAFRCDHRRRLSWRSAHRNRPWCPTANAAA